MSWQRPAYCRCSFAPAGPAWLVLVRAVRSSDGDVKIVAQRCWPLDGHPIASSVEAIAAVQDRQLATFRRLLPGYEFSEWSARPDAVPAAVPPRVEPPRRFVSRGWAEQLTARMAARALAQHADL